jgi:hypothetical protein
MLYFREKKESGDFRVNFAKMKLLGRFLRNFIKIQEISHFAFNPNFDHVVEYKSPQCLLFQDLKGPSGKERNMYT